MYIKLIRLKNFRTYKDLTLFSLSPNYNAIVGLNGSGKSNVLLAVSFVLGDSVPGFTRSDYLFKGDQSSTSPDFSAFAELILDISDLNVNTLQSVDLQGTELSLQRVITESTDTFLINGTQVKFKDYKHFLHSIGLSPYSSSSPNSSSSLGSYVFYSVLQDSVTKLVSYSAEERLRLFRDAIGHNTFSHRVTECVKLLTETENVLEEVETGFSKLKRKLSALQLESDRHSNWKQLDTRRKVLESNLLQLKLNEMTQKLEKSHQLHDETRDKIVLIEGKIVLIEGKIGEISASLCEPTEETNLQQLQQRIGESIVELNDLESERIKLTEVNAVLSLELSELESELLRTGDKLTETTLRMGNMNLELDNTVKVLQEQLKYNQQQLKEHEITMNRLDKLLHQCAGDINSVLCEMEKCESDKNIQMQEYELSTQEMERITESKRVKQRELSVELGKLAKLKVNLQRAQETFKTTSHTNYHTLNILQQFLQTQESVAYVGVLIDMIEIRSEYRIAVEQVLGSRLFTIIVSTMDTAKKLINYIQQHNPTHNIQIISLDLIHPVNSVNGVNNVNSVNGVNNVNSVNGVNNVNSVNGVEVSEDRGERVVKMLNCVECGEELRGVLRMLLKDFNLVPDSKTALKLLSHNKNSVTPTGEIYYGNGIVTGGYVNLSSSILTNYYKMKSMEEEYNAIESRITELNSELETINRGLEEARVKYSLNKQNLNNTTEQFNSLNITLNNLKLNEEMLRMKLNSNKSNQYKQQIQHINNKLTKRKSERMDESRMMELRLERSGLQELKEELEEKLASLTLRKSDLSNNILRNTQLITQYDTQISDLKHALKSLQSTQNMTEQLNSNHNEEELMERMRLENELKQLQNQLKEENNKISSINHFINSIVIGMNEYKNELGCVDVSVREQMLNNFITQRDVILDQLSKIHQECDGMEYMSKINVKEYETLNAEFKLLEQRKNHILTSKQQILQSIHMLSRDKDRNLVDLLARMNSYLLEIFRHFVPNGSIKLVLRNSGIRYGACYRSQLTPGGSSSPYQDTISH
ncbi:SMC proteins Flexible Hinge domain protein [Theileria parva strain Muguga]|uniref:SMC proteins Flexible Hinge domain protein n=1 Tax=Theileria parva strain Muguga TaxID=333668 RepID=UPI001C620ECF|nr:SMC proteins Flexible Hinge domain protein [Theileria parva strain Muguga]EAN31046.2 SMC proteins Flexible Hinge domain protein [Theileria parva strain Muguga]